MTLVNLQSVSCVVIGASSQIQITVEVNNTKKQKVYEVSMLKIL